MKGALRAKGRPSVTTREYPIEVIWNNSPFGGHIQSSIIISKFGGIYKTFITFYMQEISLPSYIKYNKYIVRI